MKSLTLTRQTLVCYLGTCHHFSITANRVNPGKHWTAEEVANTFAPAPESKTAVVKWLVDSGIERSRISLSKGKQSSSTIVRSLLAHV